MPSSSCSYTMSCYYDTSSSFSSLSDIAKIVGIVFGSLIGLGFLICIIAVIYCVCCKRKPPIKVWTQPCPRAEMYQNSTFPYSHYPQGPVQQLQLDSRKTIETPPPAYEDIIEIQKPNEKI